MKEELGRLDRGNGIELAWARLPGAGPGVVFLGGFRSDMEGTKAIALRDHCAARGQAFLRFDYAGHGTSGGAFEDGCIGDWAEDAAFLVGRLTEGPQILVGSSMGGWISLLLAKRSLVPVHALIGIAAAPDFTERLMWPGFSAAQREALLRDGALHIESPYGPPVPLTLKLIEDGRNHLVLDAPIPLDHPVRLLQGQRDAEVPWQFALEIAAKLAGDDVQITLIKDGDHRLSRSGDLLLLMGTVDEVSGR
ncbi:alpha/beta hydrolase [Pseudoroseomonas globiformis]|uniref:Palmitoyl-protein thioesterase ABHD10, mitochondrial n=1 Tax=Teichococcus globiformis TaxID=2307229 RepID=A0ABV7G1D1_9PROT